MKRLLLGIVFLSLGSGLIAQSLIPSSSLVINVDYAKTTIVMKRSLNVGFAGIQNPLFFKPNTRMLFGDAKSSLQSLIAEFKESAS